MSVLALDWKKSLSAHQVLMTSLEGLFPLLEKVAEKMQKVLQSGGTVFWMGNGGSAADAQHMAAELIGRFKKERRALASVALTTDTSILTCIANDYDFSQIFSRQLEGLCKSGDIVMGLSTSGNSPNVIEGIKTARKIGAFTVGLTGRSGGALRPVSDIILAVDAEETARIQEAHTFLGHLLCERLDQS